MELEKVAGPVTVKPVPALNCPLEVKFPVVGSKVKLGDAPNTPLLLN